MYFQIFLIFFAIAIISFYQMTVTKKPAWSMLSMAACAYIWLMLTAQGVDFLTGVDSVGNFVYTAKLATNDLSMQILSYAGMAAFFISFGEVLVICYHMFRK